MATLKEPLKFMDYIMNKTTRKEYYMVLNETIHNLWVIDIEGKEPPKELPKRMVNFTFIKVDPETIKVLYSDKENSISNIDANSSSS